MMTTRTRTVLSLAALLVVGLVAWLAWGPGEADVESAAHPGSAGVAEGAKTPPITPHRRGAPRAIDELGGRYTLAYAVDMNVLAGEIRGLPDKSELRFEAVLELGARPDRSDWLVGRLQGLHVDGDNALIARAELDLEDPALGSDRPFALRFDRDGAIVERRFDPDMPLGVRNMLGSLFGGLQVVRPADAAEGTRWSAEERGLDGPFTARYEQVAGETTKTWRRQEGAEGRTLEEPASVVTVGRATSVRDRQGLLVEARYTLELSGDMSLAAGVPMTLRSETLATLERVGLVDMAWAATLDPSRLSSEARLAAAHEASVRHRLPEPSGLTPGEILQLSERAQEAGEWQARKAAMRDLAATIRSSPEALQQVVERMRTPGVRGDGLRTMVEALAAARTEASLGAMNELLGNPDVPGTARHSLALAAGLMDTPTAEMIDTLRLLALGPNAVLDDVGTAALLGLGIQGNPRHESPHLASVREEMLARGAEALGVDAPKVAVPGADPVGAQDPAPAGGAAPPVAHPTVSNPELEAWLGAMGNLGGDEVWPLIRPYLTYDDEYVRRAAVDALYFVELTEARLALAERIEVDPSHWVRRHAIRTAGNHPQKAFEATVIRALHEDKEPAVRLEAARVLAVWGVESPGLYPILAKAQLRESDPSTRKMMGQLQMEWVYTPDMAEPAAGNAEGTH